MLPVVDSNQINPIMIGSSVIVLKILCLVTVSSVVVIDMYNDSIKSERDYLRRRSSIIKQENQMYVGGNTNLTEKEMAANKIIMSKKLEEMNASHENISKFFPARHFFQVKQDIEKSQVSDIVFSY